MSTCLDVLKNDLLKIPACDAEIVEEHVVAVMREILRDRERPSRCAAAAVADKDGLLDARHSSVGSIIGKAFSIQCACPDTHCMWDGTATLSRGSLGERSAAVRESQELDVI